MKKNMGRKLLSAVIVFIMILALVLPLMQKTEVYADPDAETEGQVSEIVTEGEPEEYSVPEEIGEEEQIPEEDPVLEETAPEPEITDENMEVSDSAQNQSYADAAEVVEITDWKQLREALEDSGNSNKTFVLKNDIDAGNDDNSIKVDGGNADHVTIDLAGHTMDRKREDDTGDGHAINVKNGATLTIIDSSAEKSGVITGGDATDGGGIKIEKDSTCNIEDVRIENNKADKDGGGIYVWGTLNMKGGTVKGNEAGDNGGGIYVEEKGTLTIDGVTISENVSKNSGGGLNIHLRDCGDIDGSITGCVISKNTSKESDGGGLSIDADDRILEIKDTVIIENTAGDRGGGIYNEDGTINLINDEATETIPVISNNKASDGGGIYLNGGTMSLTGATITGNESENDGGGLRIGNDESVAELRNCEITDNTSGKSGGAILIKEGTLSIFGGNIKGNLAKHWGGAIYNSGDAVLSLNGGFIEENTAYNGGGGIWASENAYTKVSGAIVVRNNTANDIYLASGKKLTVTGRLIEGTNKAKLSVVLADRTGTFTRDFKAHHEGEDPFDYFIAEAGSSVITDSDGEAYVIESVWSNLQRKIDAAESGETILIEEDWKAIPQDVSLTIPAGKEIAINLNGHTIDRGLKSYQEGGEVFTVNGTLKIADFTGKGVITGGYGDGGGVVVNDGGSFTFEGGIIAKNKAKSGGGIRVNQGGNAAVTGGGIEANSAENDGGGIYTEGTAVLGSLVIGNSAGKSGGGLYVAGGTASVTGGLFQANKAAGKEGKGGAVFVADSAEFSLEGGRFISNIAGLEGGGIWVCNGSLKVKGAPVVEANSALTGKNILLGSTAHPAVVTGELATGDNGAKLDLSAKYQGSQLTEGLSANVPAGITIEDYAKGIFTYNDSDYEHTLEIKDNELYHKEVVADIWVSTWTGLREAVSDSANNNKTIGLLNDINAGDDDNSINVDGDDVSNITIELNGYKMDRKRDDDTGDGHAINVKDGATLTLKDSVGTGVITGGYATDGGGLKIEKDSTCNVEGVLFENNKASKDGGGIYVWGTLNMNGGSVVRNEAKDNGGGIYVEDTGTLTLKGVRVSENVSKNSGGGLNVHLDKNGTITDCYIMDNTSKDGPGGGICLDADDRTLTITNTLISGNTADDEGGGIFVKDEGGRALMKDSSISENTSNEGGGVYNSGGTIEFTDVKINQNRANGKGGGGISNHSNASLTNCEISSNDGDKTGGGIYNDDDMTLNGCTISNNSIDEDGGGIFTCGDIEITNSTISDNKTDECGGGIRVKDGTAKITNTTISGNTAEEKGGGIHGSDNVKIYIDGGSITGNSAKQGGSGIFNSSHKIELHIKGVLVVKDNVDDNIVLNCYSTVAFQNLLVDGPLENDGTKAQIGVSFSDDRSETFTFGFSEHNPGHLPHEYFFAKPGYSVVTAENGEGAFTASEWPQLQAMINNTEEGGTLVLNRDWQATDSDSRLHIPEGKTLTIDLAGHIIDRNRSSHTGQGDVINIPSGSTLTIKDSSGGIGKITGGYGNGGAFTVYDGTLNLESGTISGNRAYSGGAILSNGTVVITGGTITDNEAYTGGGIFTDGGTVSISGGYIANNRAAGQTVHIDNWSRTDDNSPARGCGGGIFIGGTAVVNISGGMISENYADVGGGGICFADGSLNLSGNPVVTGNSGGAGNNILLEKNPITLTGTLATGQNGAKLDVATKMINNALTSGLTTSKPEETSAAEYAAAIFTYNDKGFNDLLEIRNDELFYKEITADVWVSSWTELRKAADNKDNNNKIIGLKTDITASGTDDSPIIVGDSHKEMNITIELAGQTLDRNAMWLNRDGDDGAAIIVKNDSTLTIKDSCDTGIIRNAFAENSGIIINKGSSLFMEGVTISSFVSCYEVAGIEVKGLLQMTGGGIVNCWSLDGAGAIHFDEDASSECFLKNVHIGSCSNGADGGEDGGAMIIESDLTIENCSITKCETYWVGTDGGAIYVDESAKVNLINTTIEECCAYDRGGGICIKDGTVTMSGGAIKDCYAGADGGAVYVSDDSKLIIKQSAGEAGTKIPTVISGNSGNDGGGIYNDGGTVEMTGAVINNNTTREYGGTGLNNKNEGTATLTDCTISENTSAAAAGGIYNSSGSKLILVNCTIKDNTAEESGGGIFSYGDLDMNGCTVSGNKGKGNGGGICIDEGKATITGGKIFENECVDNGGGIYLNKDTELTLDGVQITDNTAGQNGGGVYVHKDADAARIKGAIEVYGNTGGDFYLASGQKIQVIDKLENAHVGVFTDETLTVGEIGRDFTSGYSDYNPGVEPATIFESDNGYEVIWNSDNKEAAFTLKEREKNPFIAYNDQVDPNWENLSSRNWMAGLSGERYLNEINMPGTHDSGTKKMEGNISTGKLSEYSAAAGVGVAFILSNIILPGGGTFLIFPWLGTAAGLALPVAVSEYFAKFSNCQTRYIDEQLNDGIRSLDIRLCNYYSEQGYPVKKHDDGKNLWLLHGKDENAGSYFCKDHDGDFLNFREVLDWCEDFLEKHPTETIILDFAINAVDDDEDFHEEALERFVDHIRDVAQKVNPSTGESYLYMEDGEFDKIFTHYPQLKDCRGKIVIKGDKEDMQAAHFGGLTGSVGLDHVDRPEGSYKDNADTKIKNLTAFYSNHGYDPLPTTADQRINYYYSVGTNGTDTRVPPEDTPLDIASDVLPVLFDDGGLLTNRQGYFLGLVNMDGENAKNTKQVWITNFGALEYCKVTAKENDSDPNPKEYWVLKNTSITIPECIYSNPNGEGKLFQYWEASGYSITADTNIYHPTDSFVVKGDVTFTAIWEPTDKNVVRIVWNDGNNADELRPDSVNVTVLKETGGEETVAISAAENWRKNIEALLSGINVPEVPEGYTYEVKGTKITMTHKAEKTTDASGEVTWSDDSDTSKRPESVTIRLIENGNVKETKVVTADDNWAYSFGSLPVYDENNLKIAYTLETDDVVGYSTVINGFSIRNIVGLNLKEITGMMIWADNNNAEHKRPTSSGVPTYLYQNGVVVSSQVVNANSDGDWVFTFRVDESENYNSYAIAVEPIPGYTTNVSMGNSAGDVVYIVHKMEGHKHTSQIINDVTKEPTCDKTGLQNVYDYCSVCGELQSLKEETIPALGHDWSDWVVEKAATATENGLESRTCMRDTSHKETRVIPRAGHVHHLVEVPAKAATCTEDGNIRYWKCTGAEDSCGLLFRDPGGAEWVHEEGVIVRAVGHEWGDWKVEKPATETEEGLEIRTCVHDASHQETRAIPKTGHEHTLINVPAKPATCTEDGNIEYWKCTGCSLYFKDALGSIWVHEEGVIVHATGHDWGEWKVKKEATETEEGLEERVCKNDSSHKETRTIPKTGHVHTLTEVPEKAATCTEDGNIEYWKCTGCGLLFKDSAATQGVQEKDTVIPATGHDWGDPEYTWTDDNSSVTAERVCKHDASHVEKETVKTSSEVTKEPTCEGTGIKLYTAEFSNKAFETQTKQEEIPATGHTWGEPVYTWAVDNSTVTATRTCEKNASHVETETAQTTSVVTKQPTETEPGEKTCTAEFVNEAFKTQTKTVPIPTIVSVRHDVIVDNGSGKEAATRNVKEGNLVVVMARPAEDSFLKSWNAKLLDADGKEIADVTESLLGDIFPEGKVKAAVTFQMPIGGASTYTPRGGTETTYPKEYSLSITANTHSRISSVTASPKAPVAGETLEDMINVTFGDGTSRAYQVMWTYTYSKNDEDIVVPTSGKIYNDTLYTATIHLPADPDRNIAFTKEVAVNSETGTPVQTTVARDPADGGILISIQYKRTAPGEKETSEDNLTMVTIRAWDLDKQDYDPGMAPLVYYANTGSTVTLSAPGVPGQRFSIWDFGDSGVKLAEGYSISDKTIQVVIPATHEAPITINACYTPIVQSIAVTVDTPVAEQVIDPGKNDLVIRTDSDYQVHPDYYTVTWTPELIAGTTADYETIYTATVALKPDPDGNIKVRPAGSTEEYRDVNGIFLYSENLVVTVNGEEAVCDKEGNLVVHTFPETGKRQSTITYYCAGGKDLIWTKGSKDPAVIIYKRSENDAETFDHFTGVFVDGKAITDYTAESGSVIIKVAPEYLETLAVGKHTFKAVFDDGESELIGFSIKEDAKPVPTGDTNNGRFWLVMIVLSMLGIALSAVKYRTGKRSRR